MNTGSALFGKVRLAVLTVLFAHADEEFYLREIVRAAGVGHGAVQRELAGLANAGIVTRTRRGNRVFYQANHSSPIYRELQSLVIKTAGIADVIRGALEPLASNVDFAFVFGSVAKGAARSSSDVDLMVVGSVSLREVVAAAHTAQDRLEREINPSVFSREEFAGRLADRDHFLTMVVDGPKLFLLGDEDDIGKLVGQRLGHVAHD